LREEIPNPFAERAKIRREGRAPPPSRWGLRRDKKDASAVAPKLWRDKKGAKDEKEGAGPN